LNDLTQIAHGAATENTIAAIVAATVVSRPRAGEVVIDAGSKSLTSDLQLVPAPRPPTYGRLAGHEDAVITRVSEEHAVIQVPDGLNLELGDRVAVIPNHICPVINLFDQVTVVSDDGTTDRWPVSARGKCR
jgi:D-serine deaminase-like pyridoxal phosphate-dependent protein